jgi:hypothetical protein
MTDEQNKIIGELQRALGRVEGGLHEFKAESSRQRTALFEKVDSQGHQLAEVVAQIQNLVALAGNAASVPALAMRLNLVETDIVAIKPKLEAQHDKEVSRTAVMGAFGVTCAGVATAIPHAWTAIKAWFMAHPPTP